MKIARIKVVLQDGYTIYHIPQHLFRGVKRAFENDSERLYIKFRGWDDICLGLFTPLQAECIENEIIDIISKGQYTIDTERIIIKWGTSW